VIKLHQKELTQSASKNPIKRKYRPKKATEMYVVAAMPYNIRTEIARQSACEVNGFGVQSQMVFSHTASKYLFLSSIKLL